MGTYITPPNSLKNTCTHTHISMIAVIKEYISTHFTDSKVGGEEDLCLREKKKFPDKTVVIQLVFFFFFSDWFANVC